MVHCLTEDVPMDRDMHKDPKEALIIILPIADQYKLPWLNMPVKSHNLKKALSTLSANHDDNNMVKIYTQ